MLGPAPSGQLQSSRQGVGWESSLGTASSQPAHTKASPRGISQNTATASWKPRQVSYSPGGIALLPQSSWGGLWARLGWRPRLDPLLDAYGWKVCDEAGEAARTSTPTAGLSSHLANVSALSTSQDGEACSETGLGLHRMVQGKSEDALVRKKYRQVG